MKIRCWVVLAMSLLLLPASVMAQTAVLVHGFQSGGMSWRQLGVTPVLQQSGWVDGGHFVPTPYGPSNPVAVYGKPERIFYTVELPARAPFLVQAYLLDAYLQQIYRIRQEPLTLVGHSAGGVTARTWLVTRNSVPVEALVSIAAPHLGTPVADMACIATDFPMASLAGSMMGLGKWSDDAEQLYEDMRVEKPGRFLYWLNHQQHPPIRYVSLVRDQQMRPDRYDFVVPDYSQDMNRVFALRGRSEVWPVENGHFLGIVDGYALARVLR